MVVDWNSQPRLRSTAIAGWPVTQQAVAVGVQCRTTVSAQSGRCGIAMLQRPTRLGMWITVAVGS